MKNPYKILNLQQTANASEIAKSQLSAMRAKKYSIKEIAEAQATLRKPPSRLAADFTFPIIDRGKITLLKSDIKSEDVNLDILDENKYDSLK